MMRYATWRTDRSEPSQVACTGPHAVDCGLCAVFVPGHYRRHLQAGRRYQESLTANVRKP